MLIEIEHALRFEYDGFIHESFMELRVEPLTDPHQTLRSFYLAVGPPARVSRYGDWNGNLVHHFGVTDYHDRIEILVRSAVATQPAGVDLAQLSAPPPEASGSGLGPLLDFALLGGPVERTPELERLVAGLPIGAGAPLGEQIAGIGHHLYERFEYRRGVTDYRSTTQHILEYGGGVCQDFAHLMLGALRLRHVPCRYVSGYLHLEQGNGEPSQSHAWVEAYAPGHGWVGFDPTHDRVPDERYVVVARGRHYDDVPPNRGIFRGQAHERLHASVSTRTAPPKDVASLHEEIGQLDVPVFRDQPRGTPPGAAPTPDPQEQQQQ
jgi:transglutaminase-like putative cysteine protease